jgi:hypothetical protein
MKLNNKATVRWAALAGVSVIAFTGGWFTGHGMAREVITDPSHACLAASQYASLVLERERQGRLIVLNQEDLPDREVRERYVENNVRRDKATVLHRSFEDQCQLDLQDSDS